MNSALIRISNMPGRFHASWWMLFIPDLADRQRLIAEETGVRACPSVPAIESPQPESSARGVELARIVSASPQLENGYTRIADEILEALAKVQISGHGWRILIVVIRQTYGWGKKTDWIAYEQFIEKTGLKKQRVYEAFRDLCKRNILTRSGAKVGFQKDHTRWIDTFQKRKSRKNVTITEKRYSGVSNRKSEICNEKPGPQYILLQKTKECGSPTGSPPPVFNPEKPRPLLSESRKPSKTRTPKEPRDPRVSEVITFFFDTCLAMKGFKPDIAGGKDGSAVKSALQKMSIEEIKACVTFFLGSKKAAEYGIVLSTALSAHTVNLWRQKGARTLGDPGLVCSAGKEPGL